MRFGKATRSALAAGAAWLALSMAVQAETPKLNAGTFAGAFLAGRVAEADNDYSAAVAYYERALLLDAGNDQIRQSLMLTLIAAGQFDRALPHAEKLKSVAEVERFSRMALAADALRKKDYKAAQSWLQLALESDLDRLVTRVMSAWAVEGDKGGKAALAALDAIEGPEWFRVFTTYHRALIADASGLKKEAGEAYAALTADVDAAATAPDTFLRGAEAYASFLARENRRDESLAVLDTAQEAAPGRVSTAALRAKVEAGEKPVLFARNPAEGASEILLNMATALNRSGGEPFVRLYLNYALALRPQSDEALIQLASVDETQQKPEAAIALYERIPDASPLKRAAELQLGLNLADLKRYDEAITHLKALLESDQEDLRAYLALGGVYAAQEDYRSAADLYDRAVALIPEPTPAEWNIFYQRGIAYERLKEWPKAEPNFFKALELNPDQPQVLNYLGYSWVDMNMNLERGLEMIRKAVELRPSDGYIVDSLGWAYYRLGRFPEAVTELERAVSLKPDDPVLNDHLGDAYWRVGRKLEATFQWSHARDLKPADEAVLKQVELKLKEGLPDAPPATTTDASEPPAVTPEPTAPAAPLEENRTQAEPTVLPASATTAAAPAAAPAALPAAYVVQRGQSLWSIADEHLGDGNRFREILDLNPVLRGDPARLQPGQELVLPPGR
ncbi:MAG: hypothetical protein DI629_10920 [Mesorhizobium amorphae]|nr:MAG: hypothetical protein DI629_10920 [Mesorhizobium amorphae]